MASQSTPLCEVPIANDNYLKVLPRSELETKRLENQHHFFPENLGYLLHPLINTKPTNPLVHIADIGTGTGIFLRDLAKSLPATAVLHGFDISSDQFPSPDITPDNVAFSIADAKRGFPACHRNKYDIVHLRLLSPGMLSATDWTLVSRNAMSLLKPGGALQWSEESSADKFMVLNQVPGGDAELSSLLHRTWRLISSHFNAKGLYNPFSYFGSVDLVSILEDVGMKNVRYEVTEFTKCPKLRTPWTVNVIECMRGVVESMMSEGNESLGTEEFHGLFDRMLCLAAEERVYIRSDIHTHVAFKAEELPRPAKLFVKAKL